MARPPNYHQLKSVERVHHRLREHGLAVAALTAQQQLEAEHAAAELESLRQPITLPTPAEGEG